MLFCRLFCSENQIYKKIRLFDISIISLAIFNYFLVTDCANHRPRFANTILVVPTKEGTPAGKFVGPCFVLGFACCYQIL